MKLWPMTMKVCSEMKKKCLKLLMKMKMIIYLEVMIQIFNLRNQMMKYMKMKNPMNNSQHQYY
jgi:hypothetical protein